MKKPKKSVGPAAAPLYKIDVPAAFAVVRSPKSFNVPLYQLVEMRIEKGVVTETKVSQENLRHILLPRIEEAIMGDA